MNGICSYKFFKWEQGLDWAELFCKHFQETLGLGFENNTIPPVNSYEWDLQYQADPLLKVKLFMRSGESVIQWQVWGCAHIGVHVRQKKVKYSLR